MSNEYVLGVHKETLNKVIYEKQGVFNVPVEDLHLLKDDLVVLPRHRAETSPDYKHFIAYNVIVQSKEQGVNKIFLYRRGSKAGEQRLKGAISMGIGGHVNPLGQLGSKYTVSESIQVSSQRELNEEVSFSKMDGSNYPIHLDQFVDEEGYYQFINDDSNEVGQVHVGVSQTIHIDPDLNVSLCEDELEEIGFVSIAEMQKYVDEMENWTKLLYQHFKKQPHLLDEYPI